MKALKRAAVLLLAAMIICSSAVYAMEIPVKQTEQMINGKQTLVKVFEVSADYDPQRLIERDLAQDGYTYEMTSIVKDVLVSEADIEISDTAVITVQVADENAARLEALKSMPAYMDYDVDGYTGRMYPIVASLSGQITGETPHSGTNRKVKTYSYPTNDDAQVPTTLDGYKLSGITWAEGPFLEGTTIPGSYTATATYSKGYSYTTVDGWTFSMQYAGHATAVKSDMIRYTLTYIGTEIVPEEPVTEEDPGFFRRAFTTRTEDPDNPETSVYKVSPGKLFIGIILACVVLLGLVLGVIGIVRTVKDVNATAKAKSGKTGKQ